MMEQLICSTFCCCLECVFIYSVMRSRALTGRLGESLEDGPHSGHLTGEIPSSSPVFQFQAFWMWNVLGRSMFECLIPRAAKSRCGVTEQDSGFVTELISWKMGPSWECRSLGGMFLKNLFCPWSFSFHHLSHFLVHYEINGSPPLCGPRRDLTTYHSLEVTEPGNMSNRASWSRWTHESKQAAFPWICLSQMFLSQWPSSLPCVLLFLVLLSIIVDRNSGAPWILPTDQRTQRTLQGLHTWVARGSERMQSSEDTENNKGCQ